MARVIQDRDRGYRKLVENAELAARGALVKVGIQGSDATKPKGELTLVDIASFAEFGIGQPERSFIRAWVDENRPTIEKKLHDLSESVVRNQFPLQIALERFGLWAAGQIQKRISDGIEPPNAPSTIERKGSATPLIDTGQLRSAISSLVVIQ